ncbi:MAG TPA: CYCXC family (seleno)protein [Gemmatimonadales bacterium]|nr:CYCXC family (seleno)protein [Gemmatimonadales bacterium]
MTGKWPWLVAGAAGIAVVAVVLVTGRAAGHPDPRPGITAEQVLPDAAIPRMPGALEAYAAARSAPQVLDGVYCHCDCSKHAGHRSLLTCFESEHGAYCDVCMGEAMLAARFAARGASLQEIRAAIDRQFGT